MIRYEIQEVGVQVSLSSTSVDYTDLITSVFPNATVNKIDDHDVLYFADVWDLIRLAADNAWAMEFIRLAILGGGIAAAGFLSEVGKDIYSSLKSATRTAVKRHKELARTDENYNSGGVCFRLVSDDRQKRQRVHLDLYSRSSDDGALLDQTFQTLERQIAPIVLAAIKQYGSNTPYSFLAQLGRGVVPRIAIEVGPINDIIDFPKDEAPLFDHANSELVELVERVRSAGS